MLVGIDVGLPAARDHEMQAVGRDRAIEQVMRRARGTAARLELGIAERAHDLLLELRGLTVGRHRHARPEAPRAVLQRLGGSAGGRDTRRHRAGDNETASEQCAAIEQAVAGDGFERRCVLITLAVAHGVLSLSTAAVPRRSLSEAVPRRRPLARLLAMERCLIRRARDCAEFNDVATNGAGTLT